MATDTAADGSVTAEDAEPAPDAPPAPGEPKPGPEPGARRRWTGADWLALALVVVALIPIGVAAVRAVAGDWYPIGDNAYYALRARDVLTEHHPLLGTWTSSSQSLGVDINNPGPLYFDALALPARLNATVGVAVGVALLNAAAIIGIAVFARRRGGSAYVAGAMAMAAGLSWTLGSGLLVEPWQPHSMLLPFLFLMVLAWSMAAGDWTALPWAALVASYILQTHLSYAVLVPGLVVFGLVLLAAELWRARREGGDRWAATRRRALWMGGAAAVVSVLCWVQPVIEQLGGEGSGNLRTLAGSVGTDVDEVGLAEGIRFVASVVALPPWWARPSFTEVMQPATIRLQVDGVASGASAAVGLVLFALVLAGAGWYAARHRDRPALTAVATAAVSVGLALIGSSITPTGIFALPAQHHYRWLWPISVFSWFAVAISLVGRRRWATAGFAVATVVLAVLNLPAHQQPTGPSADADTMPSLRALAAQLDSLEDAGTLYFDVTLLPFAEPHSGPLMLELQRRGIPFVLTDPVFIRQVGDGRRDRGTADARIYLVRGDGTQVVPPGQRRVALVEGLDPDEHRELTRLRSEIAAELERDSIRLTERGEEARVLGRLPGAVAFMDGGMAAADLVAGDEVVFMVENDLLDLDGEAADRFERYADLQRRWQRHTVAVFLDPM
jgi:hypothetical protein